MSYQDQILVKIDGKVHEFWTDATIARSIERGAHSFDLTLSDSSDENALSTPRVIQVGMSVQIYINNEQIVSGYIDNVKTSYDATNHTLNISGRSKIGDLIDCSTEGKQFPIGQSLVQISKALCEPFGINVLVGDNVADVAAETFTSDHNLDIGQPIWEFLEELARLKAILLISDADGNLVMTRAGSTVSATSLVLGKNVKSASGSFSQQQLFSDYIVCGQVANNPATKQTSKDNTQPKASISSTQTMRYRPLTISSDNQADQFTCETRARWQRNVNESRSQNLNYTVQGWRQKQDGPLWQANELVHVNDPWMGVDKQFLIVETRMKFGSSGSTTELHLMPKNAFSVRPDSTDVKGLR